MATLASLSILLKDKAGFLFKDDGAPQQCKVPKGEFVIEQPKEEIRQIESDKPPPNYRLYRDDEYVVLHCGSFDVSPLIGKELEYLLAVEPSSTRLQEYLKPDEVKKEKLDLVVGDAVMFKMKMKPDATAPSIVKGIIRYIGPIEGKHGTHFGIEIQEQRYRGKGTSNGDPYFHCGSKDAVFVSMDKITKKYQYPINDKPAAAAKDAITSEPTRRDPKGANSKDASDGKGKAGTIDSQSQFHARTDPNHQSKFKVNDRVVVKSVKDEVFNGTVKWVGTTRIRNEWDKYSSVVAAVGVDVEKKIIYIDKHFPGMYLEMTGSRGQELFKVPLSHTCLFLPEELGIVLHVDEYAKQQQEANALKWETEEAKKYGLSLEEYRSWNEYLEKANKDKKTHHPKKAVGGQEEERAAAGVGALGKNDDSEKDKMSESMIHIQTGEPLSEERRQKQERLYELARQQSQHGGSNQTGYEVIGGGGTNNVENNFVKVDPYHTVSQYSDDHGPQHNIKPVPEGLQRPSLKSYREEEGYNSLPSTDSKYPQGRSPDPLAGHHDDHHHRYPPGGSSDWYPPGSSDRYPPGGSSDRYPPGGSSDRYPGGSSDRYHGGSSDRYPPGGSSDRYPPGGSSDRYPPGGSSDRYPGGSSDWYHGGSSDRYHGGSSDRYPGGSSDRYHGGSSDRYHGGSPDRYPGGSSDRYHGGSSDRYPGGSSDRYPGGSSDQYHGGSFDWYPGGPPPDPHSQFTIGSMVCVDVQKGDSLYGVVKWIGTVPDCPRTIAGLELEKTIKGGTDGTWRGRRFFTCPYGKGYFCPLTALRQDTRYMNEGQVPAHIQDIDNPLARNAPVTEEIDTIGSPDLFNQYIGDGRGIQGHHGSCYLDSTVFGLFALSESFDDLLLEEPTEEVGRKVKYYLWKGIVNPLRKYGLARYESLMDLRDSLEEFGRMKGAKTDEKDPEEFLNLLFKEVLHIPPFLTIKRPFGIEKEFFIQLFFEIDPNNTEVSKTEKLIAQMFHEQNISFTRVPSKLLLQMPRFGKEFKMYNKIIPSLTLDVKPLMDPSARGGQKCTVCLSSSVSSVCHTCPKEVFNITDRYVYYCSECNERVHGSRKGHHVVDVNIKPGTSDATNFSKMQLLSVICIETSHYVCYTRSGDKWLFHDSMADRLYDMYNVPRVVDVTAGLQEWIYSPTANEDRLMNTPARDIPEYVHRFTQDIYMCVYVNPDLDMYGFDMDDDLTFDAFPSFSPSPIKESRSLTKRELHHTNEEFHQLKKSYEDLATSYQNKTEEHHQLQDTYENLRRNYQRKEDKCYQLQKSCDALATSNEEKEKRIRCYQQLVQKMEADQVSKQNELARLENSWKISSGDIEYTKTKLGTGGWAKVTIGKFHGKDVAVKRFYKVLLKQKEQSSHYMELLHREINTMSQLRHPNLLQFIGAVLDHPSGNPMIITEVMDTSLRSAYERKELTTDPGCRPVILSIMRDVAVGLNYLHCLPDPIIHRDVSSANVLLESKGDKKWKTKISDFGSAKLARAAVTAAPGAAVYSAPESIATLYRKKRKQTPKMDSYSYGVLLCEVLTCRFPDVEKFETLSLQVRASSPQLHDLIVLCINEEPDKRPMMSEIIVKLDRFIA